MRKASLSTYQRQWTRATIGSRLLELVSFLTLLIVMSGCAGYLVYLQTQ